MWPSFLAVLLALITLGCQSGPARGVPQTVSVLATIPPEVVEETPEEDLPAPVENPWIGQWTRTPEYNGELTIGPVGEEELSFDLRVDGPNGHVGHVSGSAALRSPHEASFRGENGCELVFVRGEDAVEVRVSDWTACSTYHGARCYLDGRYTRPAVSPSR